MNSSSVAVSSGTGKKAALQGPCYLKMLVNNLVAGSIIGKSGAVIASIEQQTGCTMKLSPSSMYFPGTQDRIVVMSGQQEQINNAMLIILDKMRETLSQSSYGAEGGNSAASPGAKISAKVVLPKSAVSAIIGKGGQQVKQLQETTGAKVQISSREEGMNERVVTVTGTFEALQNATLTVAAAVQADQNLKDHMYVTYNKLQSIGYGTPMAAGGTMVAGMQQAAAGYAMPYLTQHYAAAAAAAAGAAYSQMGAAGMQTYAQNNPPNEMLSHQCEIVLQIPDQCVGPVIGKNGVCLSEIIHASGSRVQISQKGEMIPGTQDRRCVISGTVGSVHAAHIMMLQRLEAAQGQAKFQQGSNGGTQGVTQQHLQAYQQMHLQPTGYMHAY